jgi:hypothetical protein
MGDGVIKSFTVVPQQARHCDKCGVIVAPDRPFKSGILVREGPTQGFFHNSNCWIAAREEMEGHTPSDQLVSGSDELGIETLDDTRGL